MKNFRIIFILSVLALATSISCSNNPSTNEQSSQSSTQPENELTDQVAEKPKPTDLVAVDESVAKTVGDENAAILELLKEGPDFAANILGYNEFKTEAYDESLKWLYEAARLETTQKHMSDHGLIMSSQQVKDLKSKEIDAIEQFVYWSDERIEELTEKVDEFNKSGETIKAQVYENEIKFYEELIKSAKISWQRINK